MMMDQLTFEGRRRSIIIFCFVSTLCVFQREKLSALMINCKANSKVKSL
jgi:hypothetical protein